MTRSEDKNNFVFVAVTWAIFSLLYFRAQIWMPGQIKRMLLLLLIMLIMGAIQLVIVNYFKPMKRAITSIRHFFLNGYRCFKRKPKVYLLVISSVAFTDALVAVLVKLIAPTTHIDAYILTVWTVAAVDVFIFTFIFRKNVYLHPERMFFIVSMITGIMLISILPPFLNCSWDEESHYSNTLKLVTLGSGQTSSADEMLVENQPLNTINRVGYTRETYNSFKNKVDKEYNTGRTIPWRHSMGVSALSYIPETIGVVIGRGLHMPFFWVYRLGKFFNLLFYATIISFAIRKLRYGKMIAALVGLIPTSLYEASAYSYDGWMVALLILGFSYLISIFQNKDISKASNADLAIALMALTFGFATKAVYIFLILPLFFLPKDVFATSTQRKKFLLSIVICSVAILVTFVIPMLLGTNSGDQRGVGNINPSAQLAFVMSHPIQYSKILFNFLKRYLAFETANGYLVDFAYVGIGKCWVVLLMILGIVTFVDHSDVRQHKGELRFATILSLLIMIMVIPSSMYLVFTSVGANVIQGVQWRYLLPLVFPTLYFVAPDGFGSNNRNDNTFVILSQMAFFIVIMGNILLLYVRSFIN